MGPRSSDYGNILVIKDDESYCVWIVPTTSENSKLAAKALSRRVRSFTSMSLWISDQGTHFKNQGMEFLSTSHRIQHKFTVAYSL